MPASTRCVRLLLCAVVLACGAWLAGPASAALLHFKSPSGNINCYLVTAEGKSSAECIVRQADWATTPKKPAVCDLDFAPFTATLDGQSVHVGDCRGDVGPLCYSPGGRCSTLAYGHSLRAGTIRCTSRAAGITCRATVGKKHGFLIAREKVVAY
jgi:hypothetical protein